MSLSECSNQVSSVVHYEKVKLDIEEVVQILTIWMLNMYISFMKRYPLGECLPLSPLH